MDDVVDALAERTRILDSSPLAPTRIAPTWESDAPPTEVAAARPPDAVRHAADAPLADSADADGPDASPSAPVEPDGDAVTPTAGLHIPAFARMAFGEDEDEGENPPARRRTVLLASALALAALATVAPFVTAAVVVGLVIIAGFVGSAVRAVERSRVRRSTDTGGVALQVVASPWHLAKAIVLAIPSLALAAALAAGVGYVGWWLTRDFQDPVVLRAGVLAIAAVASLVLLSRGPLSERSRAGAHRVAAALSPSRSWAVLWVLVCLTAAVACAGIAAAGIAPLSWPLAPGTLGP
jgi:hypothetical protein